MSAFTLQLRHSPALAVQSHGWPLLAPLSVQEQSLRWITVLPDSGPGLVVASWTEQSCRLRVRINSSDITDSDDKYVRHRLRWMFRADEDFTEFWNLCESDQVLATCSQLRAGALIRSASIFEDVIKTICTVNCHWRNTKNMISNLCEIFGHRYRDEGFTFPTVRALASARKPQLRRAGLGYRVQYVQSFAKRVVDGTLDPRTWIGREPSSVREELLAITGIGPYAANHILMLLGYYGFIPCDSEVCAYLGLPPRTHWRRINRTAREKYGQWGDYAFLAYKFDRVLRGRNYVDC